MKVGIFDSGMGGISVLYEARKHLPNEDFIYYGDSLNAPYGTKTSEEVIDLCIKICDYFLERSVDAIVIACNTATSAAAKVLRKKYDIPIIGMEPALKPAVENNDGKGIAVMATEMTLKEKKFNQLMKRVASQSKIYKIAAPKIVELVEADNENKEEINQVIRDYFKDVDDIECVVLGCTHFIFVRDNINEVLGDLKVIDGNYGTVMQLKRKLEEKAYKPGQGRLEIVNSAGRDYVILSEKLLNKLEVKNGN